MTIHSPIDVTLREAEEFAKSIYYQKDVQETSTTPDSYTPSYYHSYWFNHCGSSCGNSTLSKKNKLGLVIGVAVFTVATIGYFLGQEIGKIINGNALKKNLHDRKIAVIETTHPLKEKAIKVIDFQNNMLDFQKSEAKLGLATKSAMIASVILAASGIALSTYGYEGTLLTSAGAVAGLGSAGASLYRWGYLNNDTILEEKSLHLYSLIDQAQRS